MKRLIAGAAALLFLSVIIISNNGCEKLDELTGSSKPGKISGVVTDSISGQGLTGVTVTTIPPTSSAQTDADGAFVIEEVEKGDYNVKAVKADYNTKLTSATVAAEKTTIVSIALSAVNPQVGSIQGTVLGSADNKPVIGATITTDPVTHSVVTDTAGKFTMSGIPVRSYAVTATAAGFQNGSQNVQVVAGQTATVSLVLIPIATGPTGTIKGRITDSATGQGLADADVTTVPATRTVKSDGNGNYEFTDIPVGSYTVTAQKTGYTSASFSPVVIASGGTQTANLQLIPMGTGNGSLQVTVLLTHQGVQAPVLGVTVTVNPGHYVQQTDTTGKVLFTALPSGQYTVRCEHLALIPVEQQVTITSSGRVEITIPMEILSGTIEGKVMDAATRTPLQNVSVMIETYNNLSVQTDAGGTFRFEKVPAGIHTLKASDASGNYEEKTMEATVSGGGLTPVEFLLQPKSSAVGKISGTVQDNSGKPLAATITVSSGTVPAVQTDGTGKYTMTGVPFGTYELEVQSSGYIMQKKSVTLSASVPTVQADFTLQQVAASATVITGRVLNASKVGETGVLVSMTNPTLSVFTTAGGVFELKGSIPAGSYQLTFSKQGFNNATAVADVRAVGDTVYIGDVTLTTAGVTGVTVSGKVFSITSMNGVPNANVSTSPSSSSTVSGSDGSYRLTGVAPGTYEFILKQSSFNDANITGINIPNQSEFLFDFYMYYGKYTSDQLAFFPFVTIWQDWKNSYWGNTGALTAFGTIAAANRFSAANHARTFTGNNDYLVTGSVKTESPIMMSCWIKLPASFSGSLPILSYSDAGGMAGWSAAVEMQAGKPTLLLYARNTDGTISFFTPVTDTALVTERWIMVTVGLEKTAAVNNYRAVAYINGAKKLDQTQTFNLFNWVKADRMFIGRAMMYGAATFFKGTIDDVRLFGRFLPDTDISDLFREQ